MIKFVIAAYALSLVSVLYRVFTMRRPRYLEWDLAGVISTAFLAAVPVVNTAMALGCWYSIWEEHHGRQ